ncbi:hypothetical protein DERP_003067 [Dermatophagoides pteronyssinus]|uniref:Uncharacterized protein n=1 Tax=Dermatophagoides pteronyssinus TaxID=6956 RepID=A0ABQ8JII0_DERPT|nr:hypothetical protein DERP_003067 [Dermatophagoides pteronyssinus]
MAIHRSGGGPSISSLIFIKFKVGDPFYLILDNYFHLKYMLQHYCYYENHNCQMATRVSEICNFGIFVACSSSGNSSASTDCKSFYQMKKSFNDFTCNGYCVNDNEIDFNNECVKFTLSFEQSSHAVLCITKCSCPEPLAINI